MILLPTNMLVEIKYGELASKIAVKKARGLFKYL
jgi:hypothetical protein